MSLLEVCTHPGCTTLTIGGLCVEHEPVREPRVFPRGRPFPALQRRSVDKRVVSLRPQGGERGELRRRHLIRRGAVHRALHGHDAVEDRVVGTIDVTSPA